MYRFECSTEGCTAVLESSHAHPSSHNPRNRWLFNVHIKLDDDDGGGEIIVNLCPDCAAYVLNLNEDFYRSLERTENMIEGNRPAHISDAMKN